MSSKEFQIKKRQRQEGNLSTPQLLIWLIEQFQSTTQARLPWVIVLDHVEHFTRHARQSFLYALLDTTTHSFSPPWTLAVIGVSTNLDLPHLLEKRVKSRFSQTIVQVPSLSSLSSSSSIPSFLFHALNPKDLDPRVNACAFLQTQLHFPKLKDPIPFLTVFHLTLLQPCQTPQTLTSLFPCIQSMYPHCTLALLLQGLLELTQFGYLSSSSSTTTSSSSSRRVTQVGCTEVSPCTWKWYQLSQVGFHQLQTKVYQHLNLPPFHDRPLPGIGPSSSSSATKRNIKKIRN
ncbi:hypothetical protein HMI56_001952 [Coelomomyces lativittatus]|nr:hypothetical protein HMI56_001952 [Coelomomyces lativittatus]